MKKLLPFLFLLILFTTSHALAVEIAWMQVQHRQYGSGQNINRLGFGLIDDRSDYVRDDKDITEIKLYNSDKKEMRLSEVKFDFLEEISGSYDFKNSQWYYNHNWLFDSWFSADILDSLNPGIYRLKITAADGRTSERAFEFNQQIALPIVDAGSFQINEDSSGNLIWSWSIPVELGQLSLNHKMRARAAIDIYKDKKNVAYFSIILPVHMGYVFIPQDVVQSINQKGDQFEIKISLETRDKSNRAYSKALVVDGKLRSISRR